MYKEHCVYSLTNECLALEKPKKSASAGIKLVRRTWFKIVAREETVFSAIQIQGEGLACWDELMGKHWRTLGGQLGQEVTLLMPTTGNWRLGLCSYISRTWVFCSLRKVYLGYKAFQRLGKDLTAQTDRVRGLIASFLK